MAKAIMIQGTASNAGKSIITAGLCRIFSQDGYKVAPFKSQNMALNSFITDDGLEMGRAQVVQAEAAYRKPDIRMNPILLKPTSDKGSQVILNGEVVGNTNSEDYYKNKEMYIQEIMKSYNSLAAENDIIIIEGAGSPAEINLKEIDFVNMGMAKMANAPVLIVGDIDRGGVFASLYGTYMLQDETERKYIKGNIINKFYGDVKLLEPGLKMLEDLIPVPTVGVVPYMQLKIDDEDSISDVLENSSSKANVDIGVVRLPKISNYTDFNAFEIVLGSKVRYISDAKEFNNPDLLILPGTKNTIDDLKWLRDCGLEEEILKYASNGNPIFGICGGFQMLCKTLKDPQNVEGGGEIRGLGLINAHTIFRKEKIRTRVRGIFENSGGIFSALNGLSFEGYEIHMGITDASGYLSKLKCSDGQEKTDGICQDNVYGSYVHGIFDNVEILTVIIKALYKRKGLNFNVPVKVDLRTHKENEYNQLAKVLREVLDIDYIYKIINEGINL